MTLVASWSIEQDMSTEDPESVQWLDGRPSTAAVYRQHMLDTHTVLFDQSGRLEMHIFPSIVAAVRFDKDKGRWCASGRGVIPKTLDIADPNATDENIQAELYTYPIVYKATIIR
jgi:hypothetical protein